ncbi:MAG: hypothetical protein H6565_14610 [Lewinellaceae bacterium]|nr:hypothetical protein [Lewinellaceae bacterium]
MIYFSKIEDDEQPLRFTVSRGGMLVLRIALKSNFVAPAVLQPRLGDWVAADGTILEAKPRITPAYVYASPDSTTHITIAAPIPATAEPRQLWSSALHFSSYRQSGIKVLIEVVDADNAEGNIDEYFVDIAFPRERPDAGEAGNNSINQTEQTARLLAMMAGLEVLPAKWLVAEMVLSLCERGMHVAEEEEYRVLAEKLAKTRFFKNAVLVFSSAQFVHWVLVGLSISSGLHAVTARKKRSSRMFHNWEEWLMNLAGHDIEKAGSGKEDLQFPQEQHYETVAGKIGMEPDKWLLYMLLGLMQVSPRQKEVITQLCEQAPDGKKAKPAGRRKPKDILNEKGSLQR